MFLKIITFIVGVLAVNLFCCQRASAFIPETNYSPKLGVTPQAWQFQNQAQMEKVASRWIDDPRASYYIINRSYRLKMSVPAARHYIRLSKQKNNQVVRDLKRVAISYYACSVASSTYNFYNEKNKQQADVINYRGLGSHLEDRILKEFPKSPELRLFIVASNVLNHHGRTNSKNQWPLILQSAALNVKSAPSWSDTHYWYGFAIEGAQYFDTKPNAALLFKAKSALERASKLDPGLRASCYLLLAFLSDSENQNRDAFNYLKRYFTLRPDMSAQRKNLKKWYDDLAMQFE